MRKLALSLALLLGVAVVGANAQTNRLNEQQAIQHLQQQGYTDVNLKPMASRSLTGTQTSGTQQSGTGTTGTTSTNTGNALDVWSGTAVKDGKQVNIEIDSNGKIVEK